MTDKITNKDLPIRRHSLAIMKLADEMEMGETKTFEFVGEHMTTTMTKFDGGLFASIAMVDYLQPDKNMVE